jgi:hypothetical protein
LVRKEPIEDKKKDLCSGIGSGSGMGTEDSSRITSSPAQSPKRQQNASKVENIRPNGRNCFSNRYDSERKLEYPEKNIRNEEIMRRFRLHFAIFIRQRKLEKYNQIQEEIRNLQHQEKYLEENIEYRKLRKFLRSEKIDSQEKVPYTVYREHL